MAKTKHEKIASIEQEMKQLENQRKQLLQQHKEQERKARTKRLIERGAIIESLIPGVAEMANDGFMAFLQQHLIISSAPETQRSKPQESGTAKDESEG